MGIEIYDRLNLDIKNKTKTQKELGFYDLFITTDVFPSSYHVVRCWETVEASVFFLKWDLVFSKQEVQCSAGATKSTNLRETTLEAPTLHSLSRSEWNRRRWFGGGGGERRGQTRCVVFKNSRQWGRKAVSSDRRRVGLIFRRLLQHSEIPLEWSDRRGYSKNKYIHE